MCTNNNLWTVNYKFSLICNRPIQFVRVCNLYHLENYGTLINHVISHIHNCKYIPNSKYNVNIINNNHINYELWMIKLFSEYKFIFTVITYFLLFFLYAMIGEYTLFSVHKIHLWTPWIDIYKIIIFQKWNNKWYMNLLCNCKYIYNKLM